MSKYLVIGDSFAYLDPEHSHWFNIWAEKNDSTSTHFSCRGSNCVNITNQFKDVAFTDYDAVIYHPTHLLRTQINRKGIQTEDIKIKKILTPILSEQDQLVGTDLKGYYEVNEVSINLIGKDDQITSTYKNLNLDWLARANYFAMSYLFELIKKCNIPLITVSSINDSQWSYKMPKTVDYNFQLWKMFLKYDPIYKHIDLNTESNNHWNLTSHTQIAEQFDYFVQKDDKIKTLLNK